MLEEVGEGLSGSDDRLMRDPPREKPLVKDLCACGQASTFPQPGLDLFWRVLTRSLSGS
jgi:hypothetical protein